MEAYPEINLLKSPAWHHLMAFMRQHHQAWARSVPDLEGFARDLHTHRLAVEREILADELARYDLDVEAIRVNGQVCPQGMTASEDYLTTAGVVKIERHLYRPPGHTTRHVCPLEMRAGIVEIDFQDSVDIGPRHNLVFPFFNFFKGPDPSAVRRVISFGTKCARRFEAVQLCGKILQQP